MDKTINMSLLNSHPLCFFIDLIEKRKINLIKKEFEHIDNDSVFDISYDKVSETKRTIIFDSHSNQNIVQEIKFSDYLYGILANERVLFFDKFDSKMIAMKSKEEKKVFIDTTLGYLNFLTKKLQSSSIASKYHCIEKCLESMSVDISEKYLGDSFKGDQEIQDLSVKEKSTVNKNALKKLRWTENVNVLVTLFYDLSTPDKNGRIKIDASKKEIVNFICNNFITKDGFGISEDTVNTILTPSRVEKRAKDGKKINIESIDKSAHK